MLPQRDGIQVVSALRGCGVSTPVLMLSARGSIENRVHGLDSGADDYLPKPFAWVELLARLRACLRRNVYDTSDILRVGDLELDCIRRRVVRLGRHADLTVRESELLEHLIRHRGEVVSRGQLARDVWQDPAGGMTNIIDVYINYLRKKLEKVGAPGAICTVRGVGYILQG
jgi:DNA-binding response OmpR family regulator